MIAAKTKISLGVVAAALAAMAAAGALIWYFFLRKRVVDFQGEVSIADDELDHVSVNYAPSPGASP